MTPAEQVELDALKSAIFCVKDMGVTNHEHCNKAILAAAEKYLEILKIRQSAKNHAHLSAGELYDLLGPMGEHDCVYIHLNWDFPILKPIGPQIDANILVLHADTEV